MARSEQDRTGKAHRRDSCEQGQEYRKRPGTVEIAALK